MLNEALQYLGRASIIPVGKDKKPLIPWKEYQTRKPTEEEVKGWFLQWPEMNIAIVTGKISNLAVVDVEKGGDVSGLPNTLSAITGNGGFHYYYQYTQGIENKARIRPLTDIRGEGGFVVAPPSVTDYEKDGRKAGGKYKWIDKGIEPGLFPKELFGITKTSDWKVKAVNPIEKGSRNVDMTAVIGGLLSKFVQAEWESLVWPMVLNTNKAQTEPLPERELRTCFNSISAKERQKRNIGGAIKDIVSETTEEEIKITIELEKAKVHFKAKNIITSLFEADVITWIEKATGLGDEMGFHLKAKSDTNKEQWARILSKAFDRKDEKEVYPWTILIAKTVNVINTEIRNEKQAFVATDIEAKKAEWLYDPFIQEYQINTIFGMGSSGKTLMALYFAKIVAGLGKKVLFIDYEDTAGGWKEKLAKISTYEGTGYGLEQFIYFDSKQIPLATQIDKIKETVKAKDVKLVIVDSASLATGNSTSDEEATVRLISALKLLKTTVLLIAHQRKNDGDRTPIGSIQYENQSRNVWNLKSSSDDKHFHIIHIACTHTKANNTYLRRDPIGFRIEYTDEAINITSESAKVYFEEKFTIIQRIENLLKNEGELERNEIAKRMGLSLNVIAKNLSVGKERGKFDNKDGKWFLASNTELNL